MNLVLPIVTFVLAAAVVVAAVCRLAHMDPKIQKPGWILAYLLLALGGAGCAGELVQGSQLWPLALLLGGVFLLLWLSRVTWRGSAPRFTRRDFQDKAEV